MSEEKSFRNVVLIAHDGAGKTALTEALVRCAAPGRTKSDGSTSRLDAEPEEQKRNFTLTTHLTYVDYHGATVNFLDAPGFTDCFAETERALAMVEGGLLLVSATLGAKHQTEQHWNLIVDRQLPCIAVVNRMDHERAGFFHAVDDLEKSLGARPVPLQLPIGSGASLKGVVDLITMKAHLYGTNGKYGGWREAAVPEELLQEATTLHTRLMETAAETDDRLVEKYLDTGDLSEEEIRRGLREGTINRRFLPVLATAARIGHGMQDVLDAIVQLLPGPAEGRRRLAGMDAHGQPATRLPSPTEAIAAQAFRNTIDPFVGRLTAFRLFSGTLKPGAVLVNTRTRTEEHVHHLYKLDGNTTTEVPEVSAGDIFVLQKLKDTHDGDTLADPANPLTLAPFPEPRRVIAYVLKAPAGVKDPGKHEEKLATALHKLLEEDPALVLERDAQTSEVMLKGMGQVHIEVAVEKLKRKFDVDVELSLPHPAYRETITAKSTAQGRYKRQTGGKGQYGDCHIHLEPLPRDGGVEFADEVRGGAIPKNFIPAVEYGIREAAHEGPLAGFPLVDFKVRCFDGSYHSVDSSEMAFRIAGSMALKNALPDAKPVLLEPMMKMDITVPEEMLGDVIGDLTSRRGRVNGMEPTPRGTIIRAIAPHAEVMTYAPELRSRTQGMGYFSMEFSHYDEVPSQLARKIIEAREKSGARKMKTELAQ